MSVVRQSFDVQDNGSCIYTTSNHHREQYRHPPASPSTETSCYTTFLCVLQFDSPRSAQHLVHTPLSQSFTRNPRGFCVQLGHATRGLGTFLSTGVTESDGDGGSNGFLRIARRVIVAARNRTGVAIWQVGRDRSVCAAVDCATSTAMVD